MSILNSLRSTAGTLESLGRATEVVQHNIANASTPGYVRQRQVFIAKPFEAGTLTGGLASGVVLDSRDRYVERGIRHETTLLGDARQRKADFADLERAFDVSGKTGVSPALANFFAKASAWAVSPTDRNAKNGVLQSAAALASSFNAVSLKVTEQAVTAERQAVESAAEINRLVGTVRELNERKAALGTAGGTMDPLLFETLEQLSSLTDISILEESSGLTSIYLAGQHALLVGTEQTQVSVSAYHTGTPTYPQALPPLHVSVGNHEVTTSVSEGKLAASVAFRNETVGSLIGSPSDPGKLNSLALAIAGRVNELSTDAGGPAIFTHDTTNLANTAGSLAVNSAIDETDLVAGGSTANDVALAIAGLANSQAAADQIGGVTYSSYWADTVTSIGFDASNSNDTFNVQSALLTQAQTVRSQMSGVSLDEEALQIVELQRAYEATSRMTRILNEMTQTVVDLIR